MALAAKFEALLAAEGDPGAFGLVGGAGLIGRSVGLTIVLRDQFVGEQIGFDFFAADVGQHFAVHFDAGAEHLAALLDHFLALGRVVDDVAIFKGQVIFTHDGADALAPAAARLQVSNDFRLLHISMG